jgi:hypothetical protein
MESWQTARFGSTAAPQAAWTADPDGDSFPNLLEFALGGNPLQQDGALIRPRVASSPSGPVFELRRRRGGFSTGGGYSIDGIRFTLETTTSLSSSAWNSDPASLEEVGAPVDNGDGTETIRVRPAGSPASAFLRLRISLLP